jgi:opacity protein-like surface antigen
MKTFLTSAALAGCLALAAQAAQADDHASGVKIGTLSCNEASGWGFVFGSSHDIRCVFASGDHVERYQGSISKFGVDIGYQQSGVLLWEVFAPNDHPRAGVLDGHYGGLTAGAAVGVGLDANALVGGSDRTISLQPVSIQGMTGLNVAAGVGELTLHARHNPE